MLRVPKRAVEKGWFRMVVEDFGQRKIIFRLEMEKLGEAGELKCFERLEGNVKHKKKHSRSLFSVKKDRNSYSKTLLHGTISRRLLRNSKQGKITHK